MNNTHCEQKLSVGDRITLGRWPQGADGRVEPIRWQVLEVREDRALVLSEYVLDARAFHDAEEPTRWKHSALRAWLNGEFLQGAFSEAERSRLFACGPQEDPAGDAMWRDMNMDDATESLEDKVFLLDYPDVARCFRQDAEGVAYRVAYPGLSAAATAYAKRKLADLDDGEKAIWWLRSSTPKWPLALIVSPVDTVGVSSLHADNAQGVRPALWLLSPEPKKGLLSRRKAVFGGKPREAGRKIEPTEGQNTLERVAGSLMGSNIKPAVQWEPLEPLEFSPGASQAVKDELFELYALAESGDARSQGLMGVRYFNGDGLAQDYEKAFKWTKKAAEAGLAPAQVDLADHYLQGLGVEVDEAEAVKWMQRAADQGLANAQANLGVWYVRGFHVKQDVAEGERLLRVAAGKNAYNKEFAWVSLAEVLMNHPDEASKREGLEWAVKAAEAGDARAMGLVCQVYELGSYGMDVFKDEAQGLKWCRAGVERGVGLCQALLANRCMNGSGVPRDDAEAFRLANLTGEQGETLGLYLCGVLREREGDLGAALDYFRRAVALGDTASEPDVARVQALIDG